MGKSQDDAVGGLAMRRRSSTTGRSRSSSILAAGGQIRRKASLSDRRPSKKLPAKAEDAAPAAQAPQGDTAGSSPAASPMRLTALESSVAPPPTLPPMEGASASYQALPPIRTIGNSPGTRRTSKGQGMTPLKAPSRKGSLSIPKDRRAKDKSPVEKARKEALRGEVSASDADSDGQLAVDAEESGLRRRSLLEGLGSEAVNIAEEDEGEEDA